MLRGHRSRHDLWPVRAPSQVPSVPVLWAILLRSFASVALSPQAWDNSEEVNLFTAPSQMKECENAFSDMLVTGPAQGVGPSSVKLLIVCFQGLVSSSPWRCFSIRVSSCGLNTSTTVLGPKVHEPLMTRIGTYNKKIISLLFLPVSEMLVKFNRARRTLLSGQNSRGRGYVLSSSKPDSWTLSSWYPSHETNVRDMCTWTCM